MKCLQRPSAWARGRAAGSGVDRGKGVTATQLQPVTAFLNVGPVLCIFLFFREARNLDFHQKSPDF